MKLLIVLSVCVCVSVAQHNLPNYFQGAYNVPNAPIPAPGSAYGGAPVATAPSSYQSQAPAYAAAARPQWSPAAAAPQYSAAAPAYARYGQAAAPVAAPAAPVNSVPSSYGWNVQHSAPSPVPQAQPQAAPAAPQQYRPQFSAPQQYAAPQAVPQYQSPQAPSPAQWQPQPNQWQQQAARAAPAPALPSQAAVAPTSPVSAALLRPASVHYANIGESMAGDYKFGYRTGNGDSFREETRAPDGSVQGQYGFVDADGKERIVKYSAGVNGFQILNGEGGAPAPSAPARAPAQQWGQPASAPAQQWGQPASAPAQQSWAPPAAAPQQQWG